jgi:hypothetical protein
VTGRPSPPSRLYLIPAAAVILLGIVTLIAHLRQPSFPALPGRGCIVTSFASPDTLHLPSPYLELSACVHISETILELDYYSAPDTPPVGLLEASVAEDPRQWSKYLAIRWLAVDTIQVGYRPEVQFVRREVSFGPGYVTYVPLQ